MNVKKTFYCLLFLTLPTYIYSQAGGHVYQFLENPHDAKTEALGGQLISHTDNQLSLAVQNPALLNSTMERQVSLNNVFYYADIKYGYAGYAFASKIGTIHTGMKYFYYGKFDGRNDIGIETADFIAGDINLILGWSYAIDSNFTAGINIKPVLSYLEKYNSYGIAFDAGINYQSDDRLFSASFVVNNLGFEVEKYYQGDPGGPLPLNLTLGATQKLRHAPFRFTVTATHLETLNLDYTVPGDEDNIDPLTGQPIAENKLENAIDLSMRHIIVGAEFVPSDNFYVAFGYNYRRRMELNTATKGGGVGFSWGFGFNLKRFSVAYGHGTYHLVGGTNYFSLTVDLANWKKL